MPPSQLKQLKASLRAEGIVGPQQSKKEKKRNSISGSNVDRKSQQGVSLSGIREKFNPFEVKVPARDKFQFVNNQGINGRATKSMKDRPGVTKGLGEESRRKTLLVEMRRRNRVGGITDKRFGENDPTMTPEERMIERFTREKQRKLRSGSAFDLEDDAEDQLTHFGQSLSLDPENVVDDFQEDGLGSPDEGTSTLKDNLFGHKRRRASTEGNEQDGSENELPERKKTKAEVMKEVIAKSKLYKNERQQAKEDNEVLREELDKEMPGLLALLNGRQPAQSSPRERENGTTNPERAALISGETKLKTDKDYDTRLRQMALDKRAKPTERTKTEEEMIENEAQRLQELEEKRLRRMRGEAEDSNDEIAVMDSNSINGEGSEDDDAKQFGFSSMGMTQNPETIPGFEDEDEFVLDGDLIASGSELYNSESYEEIDNQGENITEDSEDDDEDFLTTSMPAQGTEKARNQQLETGDERTSNALTNGSLAFTYPCPSSHEQFREITTNVSIFDLPVVIRRIRTLYHPRLHPENKSKLGAFLLILIDHIVFLANEPVAPPYNVVEAIIRHIHSMAKVYPLEAGQGFRSHLRSWHQTRPLAPSKGDLVILIAIGAVFPTSDHFHPVATPANLCMARYLSQKVPSSLNELLTLTFIETLCLQYQQLSERYFPEVTNCIVNILYQLAPTNVKQSMPVVFYRKTSSNLRIQKASEHPASSLTFSDLYNQDIGNEKEENCKEAVMLAHLALINTLMESWSTKSAAFEIFQTILAPVDHLLSSSCRDLLPSRLNEKISDCQKRLTVFLSLAKFKRQPLELHHHRPLAIKTSIPKFEESYNPDKHYDPDQERAESSKLRAEYKRERKGALRELRKDANFIARESLREKKERDAEYERKYKRLVAEIQGEEGHEKNVYEKEKRMRKGRRKI